MESSDVRVIAKALMAIAESLDGVALQLKNLGNADAMTPMGAIEAYSIIVKDGLNGIASGVEVGLMSVANAIERQ